MLKGILTLISDIF